MDSIRFHANGFYIIDLVPDDDMQTGMRIEENILDSINAERSELFCKRHKCRTKNDLIGIFNQIKNKLREEKKVPYIHIEGHASKESLQLLDGSEIEWSEVFCHFREINILCENNLFFSSGACHSAYAYKAAMITKPCPVFGLLAPEKEVKAGCLLDGFTTFYKSLIVDESFNNAFDKLVITTSAEQYSLIFSQRFFESAAYEYITQYCMGKGRRTRIESLVTKVKRNEVIPLKYARKFVKKR